MLLPDNDGMMHCEEIDCDFETSNAFELFDHCGIEFEWAIKVSKNYSFNLYKHLIIFCNLFQVYSIFILLFYIYLAIFIIILFF